MAPTDSVAEWTHAGPRPGAVGAALLATYSQAFPWGRWRRTRRRPRRRTRPSSRLLGTSHSDIDKLEKLKIISSTSFDLAGKDGGKGNVKHANSYKHPEMSSLFAANRSRVAVWG